MERTVFLLLTALIAVPDAYCLNKIKPDNKIIGGTEANRFFYNHQALVVSVIEDVTIECGGSVIKVEYILSAAHCVAGATSTMVRVAITDTSTSLQERPYIKVTSTIHPSYNPSKSLDYDVAILKTEKKIDLGVDIIPAQVVPIGVPYDYVSDGSTIYVSGWGVTSENGSTNSKILMSVKLTVLKLEECKKNTNLTLTDASFCAGSERENVCQGDSGDPALLYPRYEQVGVVSSTSNKGCSKNPSVFANLNYQKIRRWIDSVIFA